MENCGAGIGGGCFDDRMRRDGERADPSGKSGDCRRREPGNGTWLCIQLAGTG